MSTAGAKRTASYRQREKLKHETPEELDAWNAKNREQAKMSKRRYRAMVKQRQLVGSTADDQVPPVQDAPLEASEIKEQSMTSSAIRQRRYRQNLKAKRTAELADAMVAAAPVAVAEEAQHNIIWKNPFKKRGSVPPTYNTGVIAESPDELEGNDAMAAMVLLGVFKYLQKKWKKPEIEELFVLADACLPKTTGIRRISGDRYELFVQADDFTPATFKTILKNSEKMRRKEPRLKLNDDELGQLIQVIVGYMSKTAFGLVGTEYALHNFAYILSFDRVAPQDCHIDLNAPTHIQLGMLCSPTGELTWEYKCGDPNFVVGEGANLSQYWSDLPQGLQEKLDENEVVQKLLDGFGPLLSPKIERVTNSGAKVPFGTMLSLPGRVMHCGPSVTQKGTLRAVMFFTATPINAQEYDSETQYCRSTIIHDFLVNSWINLTSNEKEYMLTKWTEVGLRYDSLQAVNLNMKHKHLIAIALALRDKSEEETRDLITKISNDPRWNDKPFKKQWNSINAQVYDIPNN
jgi:hypothetical protein